MIIDGHRHIVGDYAPVLSRMDALGIDKTVLVGVGVRDLRRVTIHDSPVFRSHLLFKTLGIWKARRLVESRGFRENLLGEPRNADVLRAVSARPDRFYGFAFINPESASASDELIGCLSRGMQGLKLALVQYPTDLRGGKMFALCEIVRGYNAPVFMHLGLSPESCEPDGLAEAFPDVSFIIAHAGVQRFEETLSLARRLDNVFVDTSSYIATAGKLRRLCRSLGAGKLIFGSDVPVMCEDEAQALAKIDALQLTASEKDKILGNNLAAILAAFRPSPTLCTQ